MSVRRRSQRVRPYFEVWEREKATEDARYVAMLDRVRAGLEAM
ncbi:hypothetical protein [Nocardiopsis sp. Huas11]|nr:hypothetical protein [Nocardiopsis sp. Huas11]